MSKKPTPATKAASTPKQEPAPTPAPEPTAAAAPAPAPKPLALTGIYRKAIILHPERSLKDHEAALKAEGVEIRVSTLSTIRSDTLNTIAILKSLGKWKE